MTTPIVVCAECGSRNPAHNDVCRQCGKPLNGPLLNAVAEPCYVCRDDPRMTPFCSRCGGTDLLAELDALAKVRVFNRDTFARARSAMAAAHEEISRVRRGEFVCSICLLRKNGELPDEQPF